ncbi:uncharacterized protein LOC129943025 [Eupeodes corollae]|uniref:uncharacterized protein LOC129943025 n=1 Tax=Eupeodes corollae TaxID=290404 RepID=UPI00248F509B|nr:uncharacterized protein LOC129943025 [Eupeodes corollae]
MKFQLISVAVLIATICLIQNAQTLGVGPVGPPSFCPIHSSILATEAAKVDTPDLPADLKIRLDAVVDDSTKACTTCEGLIVWQNKVCVINNLKSSLLQIQQIQAEADARLATSAPAAAPAQ